MPSIILKAAPDTDLYCEWSTNVKAPAFIGTRAEILDYLVSQYSNRPHVPAWQRIERTDQTGTSAAGDYSWFGTWDGEALVVERRGALPRAELAQFLGLYLLGQRHPASLDAAYKLLTPFEDAD